LSSSSEEEEEEEEDISVYLRVVVCKAKSMYVRTLLYERAFSNWKNVGDVFKRSRDIIVITFTRFETSDDENNNNNKKKN
tara:strand:- start:3261 stop:3500 length:240 start_codon:yes stop_codon:yes gene_type:complete